MARHHDERAKAQEKAHQDKVKKNEDEVIAMSKKEGASDYVKEVAEDIQMRRAGFDPNTRNN